MSRCFFFRPPDIYEKPRIHDTSSTLSPKVIVSDVYQPTYLIYAIHARVRRDIPIRSVIDRKEEKLVAWKYPGLLSPFLSKLFSFRLPRNPATNYPSLFPLITTVHTRNNLYRRVSFSVIALRVGRNSWKLGLAYLVFSNMCVYL